MIRRHLEIVTRLTPLDATVLNFFFFDTEWPVHVPSPTTNQLAEIRMEEWHLHSEVCARFGDKAWTSIEHLIAVGALEKRATINNDSVQELLSRLQSDAVSGLIFPSYGSPVGLEVQLEIVSTMTGLSLRRAISE